MKNTVSKLFSAFCLISLAAISHAAIAPPAMGTGAWAYPGSDTAANAASINSYNASAPANRKLKYMFPATLYVDNPNGNIASWDYSSYDTTLETYFNANLPGVGMMPDVEFGYTGWLASISNADKVTVADTVASMILADPIAIGAEVDVEPYDPSLLPFLAELKLKLNQGGKYVCFYTDWYYLHNYSGTALFNAVNWVIASGYDLLYAGNPLPPSVAQYSAELPIEMNYFRNQAQLAGGGMNLMIGIPASASGTEWQSNTTYPANPGPPQVQYLQAACDYICPLYGTPEFLGAALWQLTGGSTPYKPSTVQSDAWTLLTTSMCPSAGSPTPTSTFTATRSSTQTFTPTQSRTRTPTPSLTATSTVASTSTYTQTPTSSITRSVTPSVTGTATSTSSKTATLSQTATFTSSKTVTSGPSPTATATATRTDSPSATPSLTSSLSGTRTLTSSPSLSVTLTASQTPSQTVSKTITAGPSPTSTWTATLANTATPSSSLTQTLTATTTLTLILSPTPTITPAVTLSFTASSTPSSTGTFTRTGTLTLSPQGTATSTPSSSPTVTNAPTSNGGVGSGTVEKVLMLGPVNGPTARLMLYMNGRVETLLIKTCGKSEAVLLREKREGGFGPGWVEVDLDVSALANGLYYSQANGIMTKWMLLR